MSKTKLTVTVIMVALVLIMISIFNRPVKTITQGEVISREIKIDQLNSDYLVSLIHNYRENNVYLLNSSGGPVNEPFATLLYSNLHKGKNLYSYTEAKVTRDRTTVKIYLSDKDAVSEDQIKDENLLLIETLPPPERFEVYYNGKRIQPETRMITLEKPYLKDKSK